MRSIFIIPALLCILGLSAQPEPCGSSPEMTSFCSQACIICDLDGYSGVNDLTEVGQGFLDFCTTEFNNMQYLAFAAMTTELTLTVTVDSCWGGLSSIEVGLFSSDDCINFAKLSDCDTDIAVGEIATFTNQYPLIIGKIYYLVMDGSDGSICSWTIDVTDGSTIYCDPLDSMEEVQGLSVEIHPNPTAEKITITSRQLPFQNVDIYNMGGQILRREVNDVSEVSIDLSGYPSGLYLARVHTDRGVVVKKILLH